MRQRAAAIAFVGFAMLMPGHAVRAAESITVFAAASLAGLLEEVGAQAGPGGPVLRPVYGSSGQLARQIGAGAQADAFIAADPVWVRHLGDNGLTVGPPVTLFSNSLVLIAPRDSLVSVSLEPGFDLAGLLGDGRLAMGNPEHVPAGAYGRAGLIWIGAWEEISRRAAFADNVRQALAWVAHGEAPLGIVYRSDAVAEPGVRIVATFPESSHGPIEYVGVVVAGGNEPLVRRFFDLFRSATGALMLERRGFRPLRTGDRRPS